nr:PREDICTED: uncharacterized protein LOC108227327 [Daucus carota subsp. sativus]
MAKVEEINDRMATMGIEDEENEELFFGDEVEEAANKYDLCLVGRFLTEKTLNTRAMKSKMADIWRPVRGINIKELKTGIFLFQFYHVDDMQWVMAGGPWSFDGAMLVINTVERGMDPLEIPLVELPFWIQLHGLPNGFMTEAAGVQLGNFFGSFLMYDPNNNSSIWRECMRIRIKIDVRKPLKRKKKICRKNGTECIVQCKYERLGDFCFTCGMVTHTERFCNVRLSTSLNDSLREWGVWLRAPSRRLAGQERSRWLRDEKDEDWGVNHGVASNPHGYPSGNSDGDNNRDQVRSEIRKQNISTPVLSGSNDQLENSNVLEGNRLLKLGNGPSTQELVGLNIDERKRRRGPDIQEFMDMEGGANMAITESALSHRDLAVSSPELLAKLAQQASQSK